MKMANNNNTNYFAETSGDRYNFALYSWVLASAGVSLKIYNQFG